MPKIKITTKSGITKTINFQNIPTNDDIDEVSAQLEKQYGTSQTQVPSSNVSQPISQPVKQPGPMDVVGGLFKLAGTGAKGLIKTLGAPAALLAKGARKLGEGIGYIEEGRPDLASQSKAEFQKYALEDLPNQVLEGWDPSKSFFQDTGMTTPSKEAGVTNPIGALAVDIAGDPLNLLGLGSVGKGDKVRDVGTKIFASSIDKEKQLAKNAEYLGRDFGEGVVETVKSTGKNLSKYDISGTPKQIITKVNTWLSKNVPIIEQKIAEMKDSFIDAKATLNALSDEFGKAIAAKDEVLSKDIADTYDKVMSIAKNGKISVPDAYALRQEQDAIRRTAVNGFKQKPVDAKIVADTLRVQLKKLPEVGPLLEQQSTFIDALKNSNLTKLASQGEKSILPINISLGKGKTGIEINPDVSTWLTTKVGQNLIKKSKEYSQAGKLIPSIFRNVLNLPNQSNGRMD